MNLTELIPVVVWPVTVVVIVLLLRQEFRSMLQRLESAKFPGGAEFRLSKYGEASVDTGAKPAASDPTQLAAPSAGWSNAANAYWLGHDLMWTIDVLLRGASVGTIVRGLRQSLFHIRRVGLASSKEGAVLQRLYEDAEQSLESDWTAKKRETVALDLRRLTDRLGGLANEHQAERLASD
jgi:hypothetical protein